MEASKLMVGCTPILGIIKAASIEGLRYPMPRQSRICTLPARVIVAIVPPASTCAAVTSEKGPKGCRV